MYGLLWNNVKKKYVCGTQWQKEIRGGGNEIYFLLKYIRWKVMLSDTKKEGNSCPWTRINRLNYVTISRTAVRLGCMKGQYLAEIHLFVNLESEGPKNLNIEKITFKVVQMKFLAMHITNQKLSFDIFTVGHLQNIFMAHDLYLMS